VHELVGGLGVTATVEQLAREEVVIERALGIAVGELL
jgi:hypothetical protein